MRAGDRVAKIASADQRLAILPLVFALDHLERVPPGVHAPSVFDAEELLVDLQP
ncbi:MAG TPA: hypothetical protein VNA69_06005 [Thermoanaerobaculia bacterium]|nr:hypothetical protein [Thermoanaerobaculia bacterium]